MSKISDTNRIVSRTIYTKEAIESLRKKASGFYDEKHWPREGDIEIITEVTSLVQGRRLTNKYSSTLRKFKDGKWLIVSWYGVGVED